MWTATCPVCMDQSCLQGWLPSASSSRFEEGTSEQFFRASRSSFSLSLFILDRRKGASPLQLEHVTAVSACSRQPLIGRTGLAAENPPGAPRAPGLVSIHLDKCSSGSIMDEAGWVMSKWAVVYFEKLMGAD